MELRVGDKAPEFTLPKQDGTQVTLSELLKRGPVVLYFYPKDETAGCTAEACSFRDQYEDFKAMGAEVVGVSSDSEESHASFAKHHRLPFILLADKGGKLRQQFGIKKAFLGLVEGRVTYVIDQSGTIRHTFDSAVRVTQHIPEALDTLRRLKGEAAAAAR